MKAPACLFILALLATASGGAEAEQQSRGGAPKKVFKDVQSLGELPQREIAAYLELVGDRNAMLKLAKDQPVAFLHTDQQLGFLAPFDVGNMELQEIKPASRISPDPKLRRITIRLDRLRVYDYPGSGVHHVMFTFVAENHLPDGQGPESATVSQMYRAQEGQGAGVHGYPVFVGLNVGSEGVAFHGAAINVRNSNDEEALKFLESDLMKKGLGLLTVAQPAIGPFAQMIVGVGDMILKRNRNKLVQEFWIGLDFDIGAGFGARLAAGDYIVVQAPDEEFQWTDWRYDPAIGRIIRESNRNETIPYNYIIFRVSAYKPPEK